MPAKQMGKCPKCGTMMYADVNGDPLCQECLRKEREPEQKKVDALIAAKSKKAAPKKTK